MSLCVNVMCIQYLIQKQFKDKVSLTLLILTRVTHLSQQQCSDRFEEINSRTKDKKMHKNKKNTDCKYYCSYFF